MSDERRLRATYYDSNGKPTRRLDTNGRREWLDETGRLVHCWDPDEFLAKARAAGLIPRRTERV